MLKILSDEQFKVSFDELNKVISAMTERLGHNLAQKLDVIVDKDAYKYTFVLRAMDGQELSSFTIDLPSESLIADGRYDAETNDLVLVLSTGKEIRISVSQLLSDVVYKHELDAEIAERKKSDSDINAAINNLSTSVDKKEEQLSSRITAEANTRSKVISDLQDNFNTLSSELVTVDATLDNTIGRVTTSEETLQQTNNTLSTAVTNVAKLTEDVDNLTINKANNSTTVNILLQVEEWSNDNISQTVSVSGVTASNNIIVSLAQNSTADEVSASAEAMVRATAQDDGTITFTCLSGKAPAIPLTVSIIILG